MLHPGNRKVLAYVREYEDDIILCVANVSRTAQPVELELRQFKGRVPVEMAGRNAFPPIGDLTYLLTLPAYGFFWFRLSLDAEPPSWHAETRSLDDLPTLVLFDGWNSFFRGRVVPWRMGLADKTRTQFETRAAAALHAAPALVRRQGRHAERARHHRPCAARCRGQALAAGRSIEAAGAADEGARYFVPLSLAFEDHDEERTRTLAGLAVTKVRQQAEMGLIADAMGDEDFCRALVAAIGEGKTLRTDGGSLRFTPGKGFEAVVGDALDDDDAVAPADDQQQLRSACSGRACS